MNLHELLEYDSRPPRSGAKGMGQPGPPSPSLSCPNGPASRPRSAANTPRRAVDVSPWRSPGQHCVSTPFGGVGAPFPPRPAPPRPSPFAPRFPVGPPIYVPVVPLDIHPVSVDSTGTGPFKEVFTVSVR